MLSYRNSGVQAIDSPERSTCGGPNANRWQSTLTVALVRPLVRALIVLSHQRTEPGLNEVLVESQRILNLGLPHHHK